MVESNDSPTTSSRTCCAASCLSDCVHAVLSAWHTLRPLDHVCLSDSSQSSKTLNSFSIFLFCWIFFYCRLPAGSWGLALNNFFPLSLCFRLYLLACSVIVSTVSMTILSHLSLLWGWEALRQDCFLILNSHCLVCGMCSIVCWLNFWMYYDLHRLKLHKRTFYGSWAQCSSWSD